MRSTAVRLLVTAVALIAGALLLTAPAQAAEPREAPPASGFSNYDTFAAAKWRFRYDCGTGVSRSACNEVRGRYNYAGWATSRIYYRPPGCTAPGVICPTYYFYYGRS
ncbi:hypothetical protein [Tenggerimyces flavus]|uniref:Uncharacterized protein n=1 Tax=Tenggerimyces flavus TaxID=1708749 RepID=A0ABV7YFE6_9ACTN|nr:hypothetical protein [Tenggerimyces flavus]MBM7785976.1 hypothetical protein [Tenggerimyces flavus]